METRCDFLQWLSPDMSKKVLMHLDDPADLVRASTVSRSWRRFVVVNGFSKDLIARLHPETSNFLVVGEEKQSNESAQSLETDCSDWEKLVEEHKVYALFLQALNSPAVLVNCIGTGICASSTDNFPEESIMNTLDSRERVNRRPSYWSSGGQKDPSVPETLTYKLCSKLCMVEKIDIQPFQAYFQHGHPIYSSKAVRFRMGHCLLPKERCCLNEDLGPRYSATDAYFWTYVSPTYPMEQANVLQSFKLPKPILCLGGFVQIELLGRVQKQEMDCLYYICVCQVQISGWSLPPTFDVEFGDASKQFTLRYFSGRGDSLTDNGHGGVLSDNDSSERIGPEIGESSGWHSFAEGIRHLRSGSRWNEFFLSSLIGRGNVEINGGEDNMSDDDEEGEDEGVESDGEEFP